MSTPTAHHVCQCCGRSGTREFVSVGTDRWECTDDTACRRRSIRAARRQKAARALLGELPTLLGDGTVDTDGDQAWFEIDTAGCRGTIDVEYHPDELHPFQVWVRGWGPNHTLTGETEGGAFDTVAEVAQQVNAILAATARSQAQPEKLAMTDARTATGQPALGERGAVPGCAEGSNMPTSGRGTRRRNGDP